MNVGDVFEYIGAQKSLLGFRAKVISVTTGGLSSVLEWIDGPQIGATRRVTAASMMLAMDWQLVPAAPQPLVKVGDHFTCCDKGSLTYGSEYEVMRPGPPLNLPNNNATWLCDPTGLSGAPLMVTISESALLDPKFFTRTVAAPRVTIGDVYERLRSIFQGGRAEATGVGPHPKSTAIKWLSGAAAGQTDWVLDSYLLDPHEWLLVVNAAAAPSPAVTLTPAPPVARVVQVGDVYSSRSGGDQCEIISEIVMVNMSGGASSSTKTGEWRAKWVSGTAIGSTLRINDTELLDRKLWTLHSRVIIPTLRAPTQTTPSRPTAVKVGYKFESVAAGAATGCVIEVAGPGVHAGEWEVVWLDGPYGGDFVDVPESALVQPALWRFIPSTVAPTMAPLRVQRDDVFTSNDCLQNGDQIKVFAPDGIKPTSWYAEWISGAAVGCGFSVPETDLQDTTKWVLYSRTMPLITAGPNAPKLPDIDQDPSDEARDALLAGIASVGPTAEEAKRGFIITPKTQDPCWRKYTGDPKEACSCGNCLTASQNRAKVRR